MADDRFGEKEEEGGEGSGCQLQRIQLSDDRRGHEEPGSHKRIEARERGEEGEEQQAGEGEPSLQGDRQPVEELTSDIVVVADAACTQVEEGTTIDETKLPLPFEHQPANPAAAARFAAFQAKKMKKKEEKERQAKEQARLQAQKELKAFYSERNKLQKEKREGGKDPAREGVGNASKAPLSWENVMSMVPPRVVANASVEKKMQMQMMFMSLKKQKESEEFQKAKQRLLDQGPPGVAAPSQGAKLFCSSCGTQALSIDAHYCSNCAAQLRK